MMISPNPKPELEVLVYVNPLAFKPRHLELLQRLAEYAVDGTSHVHFALAISQGHTWLWEVQGTEAIVLTSILDRPGWRELWIDGASGTGIVANAPAIVRDLRAIGNYYGCARIGAASAREGFANLPDTLGFHPVHTVWAMEIDDNERRESTIDADDDAEGGAVGRG